MKDPLLPQASTALILKALLLHQGSLASHLTNQTPPIVKHLGFQVCRDFFQLDFLAKQLVHTLPRNKDLDIYALILIGIESLIDNKNPDYAVVSETVAACDSLNKAWAKPLINKALRSFLEKKSALLEVVQKNESAKFKHPEWLIGKIKKYYPQTWQTILEENNQKPPLILRINQQKLSVSDYLKQSQVEANTIPHLPSALILKNPQPISKIYGFSDGLCSVQDASAQWAAFLLAPEAHESILDACAAPGGKTGHLLEMAPEAQITAIDREEHRTAKIQANLTRLSVEAKILTADANQISTWYEGQLFDKILLDAPCSATGIIRRQPDIKLLRSPEEVKDLQSQQLVLLQHLWPLLKPKGVLLYATCSILPEENDGVIRHFLSDTRNAINAPISLPIGQKTEFGLQILPTTEGGDGFYYAKLVHKSS